MSTEPPHENRNDNDSTKAPSTAASAQPATAATTTAMSTEPRGSKEQQHTVDDSMHEQKELEQSSSNSTSSAAVASATTVNDSLIAGVRELELQPQSSLQPQQSSGADGQPASSAASKPAELESNSSDPSAVEEEEDMDAPGKRKKVPLEPGFSQLHWMAYIRTAVRRPLKAYTLAAISTHVDPSRSVWMAIRGLVYDVTPYLRYHPGGIPQLMRGAGKDCTAMFDKVHAYVNLERMMAPLVIGTLVPDPKFK